MSRSRVWTAVSAVVTATAVGMALAGCQPPPKPPPAAPTPPKPLTPSQERSADAAAFAAALHRYDLHVGDMPGHTAEDHRAAAAGALPDLAAALRLAYGREASPSFADDTAVIDAAAGTAASPDVPHDRLAGGETEALHAAVSALRDVAGRVLYDDDQLPPLIDAAAVPADAARVSQGPLHDQDATDAFRAIGLALHRVNDDLQARFANIVEPTPMPAPTPDPMPAASPPATMPAGMPTTMPTSMPATTMP